MSELQTQTVSAWKRFLFSPVLADKTAAKKIAYIAVMAALCIATNMFEIKFASVQFSFTIVSSVLAGILIGPLFGFAAVFLGDGLGYLVNSMGYPYYWWVALSCASMALIAGLVMYLPLRFKGRNASAAGRRSGPIRRSASLFWVRYGTASSITRFYLQSCPR